MEGRQVMRAGVPGGARAAAGARGRLGGLGRRGLVALLAVTCLAGFVGPHVAGHTVEPAPEVLRLHVVAHSDAPRDQAVKLRVRDAVLPLLAEAVAGAPDPAAARARVGARRAELVDRAREAVRAAGRDDPVRVELGRFQFPARRWGDRIYPAGTYETVRIVIGQGRGRNFWCVLFPGLCWLGDPDQPGQDRAALAASTAPAGEMGGAAASQGAAGEVAEKPGDAQRAADARAAAGAGRPLEPGPPGAQAVVADGTPVEGTAWVDDAGSEPAGVQARWFFLEWWRAGWARWKAALGFSVHPPATP